MQGRSRKALFVGGIFLSSALFCGSLYASFAVNDAANPFGVRIALSDAAFSLMVEGKKYGEMSKAGNESYSIAYSQSENKDTETVFAVKSEESIKKEISIDIYFKGNYSLIYSSADNSLSITYSLYFSNNKKWANPYAYMWSSETSNASWPGAKMGYVSANDYGEKQYRVDIDAAKFAKKSTNIIFSNGSDEQTVDIALKDQDISASETGFYPANQTSDGKYYVKSFAYS